MDVANLPQQEFLIIGGTSKAGTTSLYAYLADHPQVCASSLKETRFFLDEDYPTPIPVPFSEGLSGYAKFFAHCPLGGPGVLMEASPDYLYSHTALQIGHLLPKAKVVFILRDPIDRLVSWFKYAKQKGMLAQDMAFEDYVDMQREMVIGPQTPVHLRALEQGRYGRYLQRFVSVMGDRVLTLSFESMKESPLRVMRRICLFAGVEQGFYDGYIFAVENQSHAVRFQALDRIYREIRRRIAFQVHDNANLLSVFRRVNRYVKPLMARNRQLASKVVVGAAQREALEEYYATEIELCANLKRDTDNTADIEAL